MDTTSRVGFASAEIVLASGSTDRRRLLEQAGYDFRVEPAPDREHLLDPQRMTPAEFVQAQAYGKAREVADRLVVGVVIGADTVGVLDGRVLGKPHSTHEHRCMLESLSGRTHEVLTGLALIDVGSGRRLIGLDRTILRMKPLTAEQIDELVACPQNRSSSGGYAIREGGDELVEIVEGSESNVVGLPLELLERLLVRMRTPVPRRRR